MQTTRFFCKMHRRGTKFSFKESCRTIVNQLLISIRASPLTRSGAFSLSVPSPDPCCSEGHSNNSQAEYVIRIALALHRRLTFFAEGMMNLCAVNLTK